MAGNEPQKQLLSLIRDYATEKSQGERRIENLKKQIEQLRSAVNIENVDLEEAKRRKETVEQEFKGYEVEMAMIHASILALEARISSLQGEISAVGSDLESLKHEGGTKRDDFIKKMFALNQDIRYLHIIDQVLNCSVSEEKETVVVTYIGGYTFLRAFQALVASALNEEYNRTGPTNGVNEDVNADDVQVYIRDIENKIAEKIAQTNLVQQEYQNEQKVHELVQLEMSNLQSKVSLVENIMDESREIQDLTRQISEQEERCASFGDELQRRFLCPSCHQDNSESLEGILQPI